LRGVSGTHITAQFEVEHRTPEFERVRVALDRREHRLLVLDHAFDHAGREAHVFLDHLAVARPRHAHDGLAVRADQQQEAAFGAAQLDRAVDDVDQQLLQVARLRNALDRAQQDFDRAPVEVAVAGQEARPGVVVGGVRARTVGALGRVAGLGARRRGPLAAAGFAALLVGGLLAAPEHRAEV
jgi:hypothetical protein